VSQLVLVVTLTVTVTTYFFDTSTLAHARSP